MNPTIRKVAGILTSDFSMNNYVDLVREIFSTVKIVAPDSFHKEYSNFSSHVDGSYHVGMYQSPDDKKIAIFAVQLQKQSFVENSRSTQRSYAKKLIENGNCDAALIAYYTPGDPKWRLSFVRLDFEMKLENGKLKASENITPAKRYSYLVGKDEPCHTAIDRFHKFIADNNSEPTMAELEGAFSVEAVTNEFFQLYCEKFYQLSDWLTKNEDFLAEAERCGFTVEQYAKKLLGQIVFLYFLQKKGWLGVGVWNQEISEKEYKNIFFTPGAQGRIIKQYLPQIYTQKGDKYVLNALALDQIPDDAEEMIANHVPGERHWGSGSKTFLRTLFKYSQAHKKHFFDNYLEPLFYDTLNRNRGRLGYSCFLHCRIPFLSGGLFEPLDGYDWRSCNFDIPDEIFSNKKFDEDLEGDGILDIFDRYNFTMSEDEPMEREVAIDPEMLGKVFENLLDVKDRKSKGAFYTPREIVHYMCQESLINYLSTNSHISEEAIRDFILYGDFFKDIDTEKTLRTTDENGKTHYEIDPAKPMKISEEIFSLSKGINNLKLLDDLLANIRVADPAVGSGAFPLGMLNEVVRARQNLSAYMAIGMNAYDTRLMYTLERSPYMLKYTTIKNCIFAADIEPSAVDIARLRLWLSLVIDDEINPNAQNPMEGHRNPSPLPNLECNIVCGNSLVDEFEGTPLINNSSLIGTTGQLDFNSATFESILPKLIDAQDRLFRCDDPTKKEDIKIEISDIKDLLIHSQIAMMSEESKQRYYQSKDASSKPYVLWQIDFAKIFHDKGGFDVVIGNPPYIEFKKLDIRSKEIFNRKFQSAKGKYDIYVIFIEFANRILNNTGSLTYINPTMFMKRDYGKAIRNFIKCHYAIRNIIDFSDKQMFTSATTYTGIFLYDKNIKDSRPIKHFQLNKDVDAKQGLTLYQYINSDSFELVTVEQKNLGETWSFKNEEDEKITRILSERSVPLKEICQSIFQGIASGKDEVFYVQEDTIKSYNLEGALVKKLYKGKDVKKYVANWSGYYVIYPYLNNRLIQENELKDYYPNVYAYLCEKREMLKGRGYFDKSSKKWYELWNQRDSDNFEMPYKIITAEINKENNFYLDLERSYGNTKIYTIILKDNNNLALYYYILAILNSPVLNYMYKKISVPKAGGFYAYKTQFLEKLPIRLIEEDDPRFIDIVHYSELLSKDYKSNLEIEKAMNQIIFDVYGVNSETMRNEIWEG